MTNAKNRNVRIILGIAILTSIFAISTFFSLRNLEKSKSISARNAEILQPSIIALSEFEKNLTQSHELMESWLLNDITDHESKVTLKELHKNGFKKITTELNDLSKKWQLDEDRLMLKEVIDLTDSLHSIQKWVMDNYTSIDSYTDLLLSVEAESKREVANNLIDNATVRLATIIESIKIQSEKESDQATQSYNKIRNFQLILSVLAGLITLLILWSILRYVHLNRQKIIVEEERDEVLKQKVIIEEKNVEILSSISYAKRLQQSMLPGHQELTSLFNDHFILYKPRDIISGDFYWKRSVEIDGKKMVFLAAADATGHGVPGAFVSFVCHSSLSRCLDELKLTKPAEILKSASDMISKTFSSNDSNDIVRDGMDVGLALFDFDSQELTFAGANNSAYILRADELIELKASRRSVGAWHTDDGFEQYTIKIFPDDMIYMFSDGFSDQFGGAKGKKFKSKKLLQLLQTIKDSPCKDQRELLNETYLAWKGELDQIDDVLIVGVRV